MAYEYGMGLNRTERIAKNVRDLLELEKGTVPYDRERGVDTRWRGKPDGRYTATMLSEITDMVNARETRANVAVSNSQSGLSVKITLAKEEEME